MQKWEYLRILTTEDYIKKINGEDVKEVKMGFSGIKVEKEAKDWIKEKYAFLDHFGNMGWELVSVLIVNGSYHDKSYYFKRPTEE